MAGPRALRSPSIAFPASFGAREHIRLVHDVLPAAAAELKTPPEKGWLVLHGHKVGANRDVVHIVFGPTGAYAINTKSGPFRKRDKPSR